MLTTDHAMLALLWSECDTDGTPLDQVDASPSVELMRRVAHDVYSFMERAEALGFDAEQHLAVSLHPDCEGDPWNQVAHDFILTRNHHGAGFWDGDWAEPWGERLSELAHSYGELHCVVGDDGWIHYI